MPFQIKNNMKLLPETRTSQTICPRYGGASDGKYGSFISNNLPLVPSDHISKLSCKTKKGKKISFVTDTFSITDVKVIWYYSPYMCFFLIDEPTISTELFTDIICLCSLSKYLFKVTKSNSGRRVWLSVDPLLACSLRQSLWYASLLMVVHIFFFKCLIHRHDGMLASYNTS